MFSIPQSKYPMASDFGNLHSVSSQSAFPKAGEIWQLQRVVRSPLKLSESEKQRLYSAPARQFMAEPSSPRYVMIVRSSDPDLLTEKPWKLVSVMVLSSETNFLSDVDVLIPSTISGTEQDLLAETWHVLPMLVCNLRQPIGQRLSRAIYDQLMSVGDAYEGLIETAPLPQEMRSLGLTIAPSQSHQPVDIQAFHQQEKAWSDVLSVPVAAYSTYSDALRRIDVGITKALYIEQELQALTVTPLVRRTSLTSWLQHQFEPGWVEIETLVQAGLLRLDSIPVRSTASDDELLETTITALIQQVSAVPDETQRCRAVKQLGTIAKGHKTAIRALLEVLRSTTNDETIWAAVESLWQIDPGNAASTRRVKLIDLGLQLDRKPVALAIALVQKSDRRMGVMLRVYPTGDQLYLPADLKLILSDDVNQRYEVTARQKDLYIQRKFSAQPGEIFQVRVALGEASVTESFVV